MIPLVRFDSWAKAIPFSTVDEDGLLVSFWEQPTNNREKRVCLLALDPPEGGCSRFLPDCSQFKTTVSIRWAGIQPAVVWVVHTPY